MNKTQAGRLLTLAWFLKTQVPRQHFDMGSYVAGPNLKTDPALPDLHEPVCGTSACALGWATVVFPRQFMLRAEGYNPALGGWIRYLYSPDSNDSLDFESDYVQEFFGLNFAECRVAFDAEHVRTPKQEAKVLEDLAEEHDWVYAKG